MYLISLPLLFVVGRIRSWMHCTFSLCADDADAGIIV
jgi:hypothetical protein